MDQTRIRRRSIGLLLNKPTGQAIALLLLALFVGCNGNSGPTAPARTPPAPTPTPPPAVNIAGNWVGTFVVSFDPTDCGSSVSARATFSQNGSIIDGTLNGGCLAPHFQGTLSGTHLTGTATLVQEGITYTSRIGGTASASELHLDVGDASNGMGASIPGGQLDLHR